MLNLSKILTLPNNKKMQYLFPDNKVMKKILLILFILFIQGCLSPIMYDDDFCENGDAQAKVSVSGLSMYGWETDLYSVTYGTQGELVNITMMGDWSTTFNVYVGDEVYLEVMAGTTAVMIAIEIYQNYSRVYENHIYVYSYTTDGMSVLISDH